MNIFPKLSSLVRRLRSPLVRILCACLLLTPLLPLIHQSIVLAVAFLLRAAASSLQVKQLLVQVGMDPVYASVFNRTMGNIDARGLAIAGPLGGTLHQLAPELFATPDKVMPGAWTSALVGDGVSLLASALAIVGANGSFIAAGLAVLWVALLRRRTAGRETLLVLIFASVMLQARGIVGLSRHSFSLQDLEIMGLSQLFTKLFPVETDAYNQVASGPLSALAPYLIPSIVMASIYGLFVVSLVAVTRRPWIGAIGCFRSVVSAFGRPFGRVSKRTGARSLVTAVLMVVAILSPGILPAMADYNYPAGAAEESLQPAEQPSPETATVEEPPTVKEVARAGPSRVTVSGSQYSYTYIVNGHPERIRGIGYNAIYMNLSRDQRSARYDWDFAEMKAAGANTILGWGVEEFDELTLEKAQEYGLGIVMPLDLPGNGDYGNPAYERGLEQKVKEWVERYRGYPALRIWGIGNEVIHYIHDPNSPRAKAFARFYVRLADEVHAIDPNHPVIYRDAEDVYVDPVREALQKDGISRPWFVYGVNFFTYRICEALPDWPRKRMDVALVVSEFAPSGLSPDDRPEGYLHMLRCINKEYPAVLGAFVYVWTTEGPEVIDRTLGLVGADGQPVDKSLWAIGRAFHRQEINSGAR